MTDPTNSSDTVPEQDDAPVARPLRPGDLTEAVPLRDALIGIGEVMQLPRKRPTAPAGMAAIGDEPAAAPSADSRPKTSSTEAVPAPEQSYAGARKAERRWLAGAALVVSAAIAVAISLSGDAPRRDPMPTELRTEWRTSHPSYEHAVLSFTDSMVQIVTRDLGSGDPDRPIYTRHAITGLEADRRGEETAVVVRYLVDGEPDQIEARLTGGRAPVLTFVRPEGLTWYPASAGTP
jgi:hypothetical protein